MTDYVPFPKRRLHLPDDGKVTGTFEFYVRGGTAGARTEGAHVNDDNPAIDYRGESFLAHVEFRRDADGRVHIRSDDTSVSVTRRSNWSDAPPTYRDTIAEAMRAHIETVWTDEFDRQGAYATAAQEAMSLERTEREQAEALRETRKALRKARKVLDEHADFAPREDDRTYRGWYV